MSAQWTSDRVEQLRKLWADGLSAEQVAAELGGGLTRNAVIGKIDRLGCRERTKGNRLNMGEMSKPRQAAPKPQRSVDTPVVKSVPVAEPPAQPIDVAPVQAPAPIDISAPLSERVTIMELREAMCRWPIGDPTAPEFRFCGARTPGGASGPYCGFHAQVAYLPAPDRRRSTKEKSRAR